MQNTWSLGLLIGLPVLIILMLVLVALGWYLQHREWDEYDQFLRRALSWFAYGMATAVALGILVGFYPYKAEYHQYQITSGEVVTISSRILGSSDSFQQKFVVRYTDGRERACEDTRCALVKPGDRLTMTCKRTWQYTGTDGWDCNYIQNERP